MTAHLLNEEAHGISKATLYSVVLHGADVKIISGKQFERTGGLVFHPR